MENIELDTENNLGALFQDINDSSVETEQEVVQAPVHADEMGSAKTSNTRRGYNHQSAETTTDNAQSVPVHGLL